MAELRMKPYPTADDMRCPECGVLSSREHLYDCQSSEARKMRRLWEQASVAEAAMNAQDGRDHE